MRETEQKIVLLYIGSGKTIPHWPLPAVRDLTRDGKWSTYDVSVLKLTNVSFTGKCARMENTLKLPSPTKLARLGHFPPASQAGVALRREIIVRGNPISLVFQNIDPPSPSPPGECVHPAFVAGGGQTRRAERGMGVNILEDERNRIALFVYVFSLDNTNTPRIALLQCGQVVSVFVYSHKVQN